MRCLLTRSAAWRISKSTPTVPARCTNVWRSFGKRFPGDLARHVVDGGKVGIAVLLRRRAYADKDAIAGANRLSSVAGVGNFSGLASGFENAVEVVLLNGHFTRLELRDALGIDVSANDIVSSPGDTCSGYETNVATTN
jgi:hypothetical protein